VKRVLFFTLALAALGSSSPARADDPPRNPALGEALFREAQRLLAANSVGPACAKFAESQRVDPQTGTLLNLALCHERDNKTATAWSEVTEVVTQAARAGNAERERFARERATALEKKLSRARLVRPDGAALGALRIDDQPIGEAAWSIPIPLDPGSHLFTFSASKKKTQARTVVVPDGPATIDVMVPVLEDEAVTQPAPTATAIVPPLATAPPPDNAPLPARPVDSPPKPSPLKPIGLAVGAVGLAGIGVGAIVGAVALSRKDEVDAHCEGKLCDAAGMALQRDAHSAATMSTVMFAIGGAALAAGVTLFVIGSSRSTSVQMNARGVLLQGRW
jgi:hypothetical protein